MRTYINDAPGDQHQLQAKDRDPGDQDHEHGKEIHVSLNVSY